MCDIKYINKKIYKWLGGEMENYFVCMFICKDMDDEVNFYKVCICILLKMF